MMISAVELIWIIPLSMLAGGIIALIGGASALWEPDEDDKDK